MLESQKELKLEADNAFPDKEPPVYKFKLQNNVIVDVENFHTDEDFWGFVDYLRNEFYSTDENKLIVPPVVHYKGLEIQIDNIPLVSYIAHSQSGHRTIGDVVANVMRNQRIMALYSSPDTEEEFSDFVDDSEYNDMTPFERAMYKAEVEAREAVIERYKSSLVTRANLPEVSIATEQAESNSQSADEAPTTPEKP